MAKSNTLSFAAYRAHAREAQLEFHRNCPPKNCAPAEYWRVHDVTGEQIRTRSAWLNEAMGDSLGLGSPGVYVWHRGDRVLYVGLTEKCLRLRLRTHKVITRRQLRDTDGLTFYDCEPYYATWNLEQWLIRLFQPPFNRR
jgi:hypothetical protein